MTFAPRYVHTNLIVVDLQRLVDFYTRVFGCTVAVAEHPITGPEVAGITGVPDAAIRVVHLLLPGHGENGPTLELIAYDDGQPHPATAANRPGFGHIAFRVDDVAAARDAVLAAGGSAVGELVSADIPGRGRLTETYVTDPEGNIIELQYWSV